MINYRKKHDNFLFEFVNNTKKSIKYVSISAYPVVRSVYYDSVNGTVKMKRFGEGS